jgi:hypothetical protein
MNDRYLRLMGMLDFELLRAFVAVAECGGFTERPSGST